MENPINHITKAQDNIFLDLGFAPEEAQHLKNITDNIANQLQIIENNKILAMKNIQQWIIEKQLKQKDAAAILGISRPRVSDIINYKTQKCTLDFLLMILAKTGKTARLQIS